MSVRNLVCVDDGAGMAGLALLEIITRNGRRPVKVPPDELDYLCVN
jgi:hypothetical protein